MKKLLRWGLVKVPVDAHLKRQKKNLAAKHAVIHVEFPEAGYFAHCVANVLPRFAAILEGARSAEHKVSVVLPQNSRGAFSPNVEKIFNKMGIELLMDAPSTPHRAIGMSLLAPWYKTLRQGLQRELHRAFVPGITPPDCRNAAEGKKLFLSRKRGASNGRWVRGSELVETELQEEGFEIKDDLTQVTIDMLAKELYQTCAVAGFAGGNLLNMLFLPPHASVVEINPMHIYADRWQFAHALGFGWKHLSGSSSQIDANEARMLAREAVVPFNPKGVSVFLQFRIPKCSSFLNCVSSFLMPRYRST